MHAFARHLSRSLLAAGALLCAVRVPAETITLSGSVKDKISLGPVDSARIDITNAAQPTEHYTVFTNPAGQWAYSFDFTGVGNESSVPEGFSVDQNFPNPFNPSTTITFTTPGPGPVAVSVHTALGQLLDEKTYSVAAGSHALGWTGKGAAGVLFYTIDFGGTRITRRMIQLDGQGNGGLGQLTTYGGRSTVVSAGKRTATPYRIVASNLIYVPDTLEVLVTGSTIVDFSLETVHHHAFLFDLHNDVLEKAVLGYQLGPRHTQEQSDLPRFREGGVDAQMFALWVDWRDTVAHPAHSYTLAMVDTFNSQISQNASQLAQARTYDEIMQVSASGKLAGVLAVEGGHAIEDDIGKLKEYYALGARYLTITWNNSTPWAVSAQDPRSATVGLSEFGRTVIRTMDTLGMLIDVSHTGIRTIQDILATTHNPIIATHSGVRALNNHYRNLTDAQIDSIAGRGGVIGVVFYPWFLSSTGSATIDTVIKHIDYIRNRVGVDCIAIGSDYDGIERVPVGLEDVSKMPNLTAALLRRGYSVTDVEKILGGNALRVFKQVCK